MGNNEPLPPPPPGNNPPQFPPQGFPPQQPYQQPTQPQPQYQQPYPGQQYPPQPQQYPPQYGQYPQAPAPAPKKNTGLIIGIGVVVVAAIVAGVLIFGGGDDKKKTTTSATTAVTTAPVTTGGNDTIVLTVPVTTPPNTVEATTIGGNADGFPVTDDTGMMTVFLPNGADYQTTPITKDNITLPRIVAATDVQAFMNDDVTQGIIFMGIPSTYNATPDDAISILGPPDGACSVQTPGAPISTPFGVATVVLYDGCGPGGAYSKVVMGVATSGTFVAIGVYLQGDAPATDMLDTAQSVWALITVN
jgi:hypothetical protein